MEERELLTGEFLVWHFYMENCQASQANQVSGGWQGCDDDNLCLGWGMTQKVVRPVQYYTRTVILTTMPTQAMSKCSMNNEAKKASFMVIDLA